MRRFLSRFSALLAVVGIMAVTGPTADAGDPENTLFLDLEYGRVVIEMRPDLAPKHVTQMSNP